MQVPIDLQVSPDTLFPLLLLYSVHFPPPQHPNFSLRIPQNPLRDFHGLRKIASHRGRVHRPGQYHRGSSHHLHLVRDATLCVHKRIQRSLHLRQALLSSGQRPPRKVQNLLLLSKLKPHLNHKHHRQRQQVGARVEPRLLRRCRSQVSHQHQK